MCQGLLYTISEYAVFHTAPSSRVSWCSKYRESAASPVDAPDNAMSAMAPVLENVLCCLTQEYEKRLQAKDHEVKASQHDVKAAQAALKQAQMELYEAHKTLAQNANALPVCETQPGTNSFDLLTFCLLPLQTVFRDGIRRMRRRVS